jgi:hypothetical protein
MLSKLQPEEIDENVNFAAMRSLHETKPGSQFYKLLVCSNPETMRGSDFRANGVPITLVVQKKFNSSIAL